MNQNPHTTLITPFGGSLVDLLVAPEKAAELIALAAGLPSLQLSDRASCDLEMLATGCFSPLDRFMGQRDYESVVHTMRLGGGRIFPIPITLPFSPHEGIKLDGQVALRSAKNELLGIMSVDEIYPWDPLELAREVAGTNDARHPFVAEIDAWPRMNISGTIRILQLPRHHDFPELRHTPAETLRRLEMKGHASVVAFQTRNPLHRVHEELTKRAIEQVDGTLLLHPAVGMTKPGDVDHYTRVRTYRALADHYYDPDRILLALLPIAMRMAGPREALWHAIIRRNHGASHFIVGRDHASPGVDSTGKPFYGPYDAQELVAAHSAEIGVTMVPFSELHYLPDDDRYEEQDRIEPGTRTASISGTEVRRDYLEKGRPLPPWFTRPEVAEILGQAYPARERQGVCVWFTGLSGAGKSTVADVLTTMIMAAGRQVTVLDGDVVRTHLSHGLGFSREDRDTNIRRIGFVAAEIVRHGGLVICAAVSPYRATRNDVRSMVGQDRFVEVFVDTPIEVCEQRDAKGMYAKARRGEIKGFTGIDDPYEEPRNAEIVLDTVANTAEECAVKVLRELGERGFVRKGEV